MGSHFHFIETNPFLKFDRAAAYGKRLDILAGTAVRFEPGDSITVNLVEIGGNKIIRGGNAICDGPVNPAALPKIMEALAAQGFGNEDTSSAPLAKRPRTSGIPRDVYARMYGPTVGDLVRLGDTELFVRVESDTCVYGDECKFGGGKTLRDGMGQASGLPAAAVLDVVITNALVVDSTGIFKCDIGIKGDTIVGLGKAGNPDVMDGVTAGMTVGVNTEAIGAEGLIVTAGAMDAHVGPSFYPSIDAILSNRPEPLT